MFRRYWDARKKAVLDRLKGESKEVLKDEPKENDKQPEYINPSSKKVYFFVNGECKGFYDSITLCGNALGMTRPMVKKAIDNGTLLDNGFILKLTNK